MRILIACEESQAVTKEFRRLGTDIVDPVIIKYKNGKGTDNPWHMETMKLPAEQRAKVRSKTFPGIAAAMAEQWSTVYGENQIPENRLVEIIKERIAYHSNEKKHLFEIGKGVLDCLARDLLSDIKNAMKDGGPI